MKYIIAIISVISALSACSPRIPADQTWARQRWVLIELKEVPVQLSGGRRDAYIEFLPGEKRFSGNGGCNQINGNYILDGRKDLKFTDVISTKMSCPDIAFETTFLQVLGEIDGFEMQQNQLWLKDGRKVRMKLEATGNRY